MALSITSQSVQLNYDLALPILQSIEAERFKSPSRPASGDLSDTVVRSKLQEWFDATFPPDNHELAGPLRQSRAAMQLIAQRLTHLKDEYRQGFLTRSDGFGDVREYLRCVDGWVDVVSLLAEHTKKYALDNALSAAAAQFIDHTKDVLSDVYWDRDSLVRFVSLTHGSHLAPYVGTLYARCLFREFCEWNEKKVSEHDRFPARTLEDVDPRVLAVEKMGFAFADECIALRVGNDVLSDFATPAWFAHHILSYRLSIMCDASDSLSRGVMSGIVPSSNAGENERLTAAMQLGSVKYAARALANHIFFSFGNHENDLETFLALVQQIEKSVIDKAGLCEVVSNELDKLAGSDHSCEESAQLFARRELASGRPGMRNGTHIHDVIQTIHDEFSDGRRVLPLEVLRDIYSPILSGVDPERLSHIISTSIGSIRSGEKLSLSKGNVGSSHFLPAIVQ